MKKQKFNIAVLIDGDNAQPKLIKEILEEVSKYGKATIRRIYGDWTTPQMNGWKETLNNYSINPVQKFSYTTGRNSTDSSLIIDAMDILYSQNVEGFCIVSSDSDYTGLAKRVREEGMFVMGIGERKTPKAFVQSCEIFTFCENLIEEAEEKKPDTKSEQTTPKKNGAVAAKSPRGKGDNRELIRILDKAFEISVNEDDETSYISTLGGNLRKIDPSFDPRTYGFRNLTQLLNGVQKYQVVKNVINGVNNPLVKLK